mgnify:CR=1 FL=1
MMRNPLSKKITGIEPSGIRKFFDLVSEMPDAISLGVGEPDFDTPWRIREEGIYTLEQGKTFYTSNAGLKDLKIEISKYLERKIHVEYDPDHEIMVTVGGSEGIDVALRAMLDLGDEVLIPQPSYVSYLPCTILADGNPVVIPLQEKNEFKLTAEELEAAITPKTKMLVMPFPNNPTGGAITKAALQEWVDYANKNGCVIIYDAAYEAYISEEDVPHSIYECEGARTCAIELRSFSKNAGFTGVRLGFTVVPKELVRDGVELHSLWARRHGTKFNGAPYIEQRAGEAVYTEEGQKQTGEQIAYYMNNAKTIRKGLTDMGYTVFGGVNAPYIWLQTPDKMKSWDFFDMLLEKANVVGTPGSGFGPSGEGYFRLTAFGSAENTKKALERIRAI